MTRREAAELAAAIHGGEPDRELTDALYRRAVDDPGSFPTRNATT